MATETSPALGTTSREELDQQRRALINDIGSLDLERKGLVSRLSAVQDELALRDLGERGPHLH